MRILLSNDDGYFAPGLERLAAALAPHAEITVVAPERDRSGASNSLTLDRPLIGAPRAQRLPVRQRHADRLRASRGHRAARRVARHGDLGHQPRREHGRRHDLLGHGRRGDRGLSCSASRRSRSRSRRRPPRISRPPPPSALELLERHERQPAGALAAQRQRARRRARELTGYRITRLGRRHKAEDVVGRKNPRGETVYWVGAAGAAADAGEGTDFHAVESGYVSVTPLQIDLTNRDEMARRRRVARAA